jgi:hypothetical protein
MEIITEARRISEIMGVVSLPVAIVRRTGNSVAFETSSHITRDNPIGSGVTQLITEDGTIVVPSDARVRVTIHVDDADVTVEDNQ